MSGAIKYILIAIILTASVFQISANCRGIDRKTANVLYQLIKDNHSVIQTNSPSVTGDVLMTDTEYIHLSSSESRSSEMMRLKEEYDRLSQEIMQEEHICLIPQENELPSAFHERIRVQDSKIMDLKSRRTDIKIAILKLRKTSEPQKEIKHMTVESFKQMMLGKVAKSI